jgi:hypothetical protein
MTSFLVALEDLTRRKRDFQAAECELPHTRPGEVMETSGGMISPYLRRQRPARTVIEALIVVREAELAQTDDPEARCRVAAALDRLRCELARLCPNSTGDGNVRPEPAAPQRAMRDE